MIKINDKEIPLPKKMQQTISDLDGKSKRNTKGDALRDRIAIKRKIECEWPPLTQTEMQTLLNAVSDIFFFVSYKDMQLGNTKKEFYVGDRSASALVLVEGRELWTGLKMNFVER